MWDIHKRIEFEERAAIMEYNGKLDRAEAERRARQIVDDAEQPALIDDAGQQFFAEMQRMFR